MEIQTPRLTLREFYLTDFEAVWEYERRPEMHRYEPPKDEAMVRQYLVDAAAWVNESPRTHYRMAVTIRAEDIAVGRISLVLNYGEIREWEIGWTIHPDRWGRGYASEGARAMLAFAFSELNAHRVVAFCHAENAASKRVMEKLGMQRDGLLRQTRWLQGAWHDEVVYAILERDWAAQAAEGGGASGSEAGSTSG